MELLKQTEGYSATARVLGLLTSECVKWINFQGF